jgi:hypothetical protein
LKELDKQAMRVRFASTSGSDEIEQIVGQARRSDHAGVIAGSGSAGG